MILETIKNSIHSPEFYRNLQDKPFSFSFKYFASIIGLASLVLIIYFSAIFIPKGLSIFNTLGQSIKNDFPTELEINIEDGVASTNVAEPYFLKFNNFSFFNEFNLSGIQEEEKFRKNLLVINTVDKTAFDSLDEYDTYILLTKTSVVFQGDNEGEVKARSLKDFPNIRINKTSASNFINSVGKFKNWIIIIAFAVILLVVVFMAISKLTFLIFGALIVFLIAKSKKIDLNYKKAFQASLHLVTLSIIISTLSMIILGETVPYLFTGAFIIVALINIGNSPTDKKIAETSPEPN